MDTREAAQVLWNLHRAHNVERGAEEIAQWEHAAPATRAACFDLMAKVQSGALPPEHVANAMGSRFAPYALAVLVILAPAPVDGNEEPEGDPDRRPGYKEKDLRRDAPHKREAMAPSEVTTTKGAIEYV